MKYTKKEAGQIIVEMIIQSGMTTPKHNQALHEIRDETVFDKNFGRVYLEFEIPVWGASCRMVIDYADKSDKVKFGWSSTDRNVAMVFATLELYQKVAMLGAKIQAFLDTNEIK